MKEEAIATFQQMIKKLSSPIDHKIKYLLKLSTNILLLCGGDKSIQKQDIDQAQKYWKDYRTSENA